MPGRAILIIASLLGVLSQASFARFSSVANGGGPEPVGFRVARDLDLHYQHRLGLAEARKRVHARLERLQAQFAGTLSSSTIVWSGDVALIRVTVFGQHATARVLVEPSDVTIDAHLPVILSPLAGNIEAFLAKTAAETLG